MVELVFHMIVKERMNSGICVQNATEEWYILLYMFSGFILIKIISVYTEKKFGEFKFHFNVFESSFISQKSDRELKSPYSLGTFCYFIIQIMLCCEYNSTIITLYNHGGIVTYQYFLQFLCSFLRNSRLGWRAFLWSRVHQVLCFICS